MNANELADELKEYALDNGYSHIDYADSMNQAATMLRQQQAEIEALKAHPVNPYQSITDTKIEPTVVSCTHPAELTDEDLDKLIKDAEQAGYMEMYIVGLIDGFNRAREILRKAKDK